MQSITHTVNAKEVSSNCCEVEMMEDKEVTKNANRMYQRPSWGGQCTGGQCRFGECTDGSKCTYPLPFNFTQVEVSGTPTWRGTQHMCIVISCCEKNVTS